MVPEKLFHNLSLIHRGILILEYVLNELFNILRNILIRFIDENYSSKIIPNLHGKYEGTTSMQLSLQKRLEPEVKMLPWLCPE